MHVFHKWRKWSRPSCDTMKLKRQWRSCKVCGMITSRKLPPDKDTPVADINDALDAVENEAAIE